ncbi:ubiquitin-conjugating enzyme, putative [Babesia ovata]|uniref:Ubiquitin-conjugating enzyme, putative n=1 Tax=Babesia ovata TaxID=189622 RepID=A0A2H6KBP8_9APIC|nr:ubiquitin-conjugating enzyme, putative [Babesia ovata]GBE60423.1 ubiquitin-conjugating enzyme, putative [Babesia ovata]
MLHPNVDESSGSVCLDVINETWTPIYTLLMADKSSYEKKVREHVKKHASKEEWTKKRADAMITEEKNDPEMADDEDVPSDLDDEAYDNF